MSPRLRDSGGSPGDDPGVSEPQPTGRVPGAEKEDTRDLMLLSAAILDRWASRLERAAGRLPSPSFDTETDEPLNLSAAWQGALETILHDELRPAVASLRRAATWTDDSTSWKLRA
ncbi:MAG: hypothetical protein MI919_25670 [Holophagales bacterium]|nr:hypothetical protein [Holophagales bacterium]